MHRACGRARAPSRLAATTCFTRSVRSAAIPQDLKYRGERVSLEVGDGNEFREFVHRQSRHSQRRRHHAIGSDNLFMAYSHIGHDCQIGSHTIFVNGATLAGHVTVEDYATIGAFCPVHQFCRIGTYAYIGASTVITQDVPPFSQNRRPARNQMLWREHRRPRAQRLFRRPHRGDRKAPIACSCAPNSTPLRLSNKCVEPFPLPQTSKTLSGLSNRRPSAVSPNRMPASHSADALNLRPGPNSRALGPHRRQRRFPFLVLEGARSQGIEMAVIAIREEASPALEQAAEAHPLGEPRRTEPHDRTAASGRREARRDGRASKAQ